MTEPTWKDWLKGFLLMFTIFGIMILPIVFLHGATAWETFAFVGWIVCVILTLNVKQHPEVRAYLAGDWDTLRKLERDRESIKKPFTIGMNETEFWIEDNNEQGQESNKEVGAQQPSQEINPQDKGSDL